MSLDALFRPRAVAVVGASQNPQKVGGMPVRLLRELGYAGRVYPVNPGAVEVQGLSAISSIAELPAGVDMAVVAVPAAAVEAAIGDLIGRGVPSAVILSSGFAETGAQGTATQQRIAERARAAGMALLGPNCLGVMNVRERLFATFSPAPLAGQVKPGPVAIVSQSGAFGGYAYSLARRSGTGLSYWVTTGNEAVVSVADVIEWLVDDDDTKVILAYIEGAKDGALLRRALAAARSAGKPVIVTKVGRTEAGARAAMSHTASLSGEDVVYQAVFDETGAIRARTIEEMFRLGQAFATGPMPQGKRLALVTVSGGVGTMMADAASDAGLELPALPHTIAAQLTARIPFCSTANPVDVTGQFTSDYGVLDLAAVEAARSGLYDAMVLFLAAAPASPVFAPKILQTVLAVRAAAPQVALALSGIADETLHASLRDAGCLMFEEPTHAVDALAAKAAWSSVIPDASAVVTPSLQLEARTLNEVEGLAFLSRHGVPAVPHRHVQTPDEAVAAWQQLGGQAVLKIVSADLLHKSDVGGVRVGLRSEAEVREAFDSINASVSRLAPTARCQGMLVARKLEPLAEVMLGARYDAVFGSIVVVGLGGVAVELHAKTAVLTAPTTPARVRARLRELGVLRLLGGWRGRPAVDERLLVDAICRFSVLTASLGLCLGAIEINPLMVTQDGVAAADAVVAIVDDRSTTQERA